MKNKILCFILALLTCISLFAACDDATVEGESTTTSAETEGTTSLGSTSEETTAVAEPTPSVEKTNYDDDFYLSIVPDVNPIAYYWVEESNNDTLTAAIFARQEKVREYLGIEIIGSDGGNWETYTDKFKTAVKNKTGAVDTLLSHVNTGVSGFISGGYLRDFADMSGIDLDSEHWNADFMESLSVNDKYYLGFSDFNILYTWVISFNKDIMVKYEDHLEKDVYQMVRDREWTVDALNDLAKLAYIEGNSVETTQFGLTGQQSVAWVGFMHASELKLVEQNDNGLYEVSFMNDVNSEKMKGLVSKLYELSAANYTCFDYMTTAVLTVSITSGKTLMQLSSTYHLPEYLNYGLNFGILPYPLYSTDQKDYHSLQWGGYLCIPAYLRNEQMTGDVLEVLSFYSADVNVAFYDKLLGKQVAENPHDREMLNIVWEGICTDFGQTFDDEAPGLCYFLPTVTSPVSGEELTNYYQRLSGGWNTTLKNFIKKASKNK